MSFEDIGYKIDHAIAIKNCILKGHLWEERTPFTYNIGPRYCKRCGVIRPGIASMRKGVAQWKRYKK